MRSGVSFLDLYLDLIEKYLNTFPYEYKVSLGLFENTRKKAILKDITNK